MKQMLIIICASLITTISALAQKSSQDKVEISTNPPPPALSFPVVKELGKAKAMYNQRADKLITQTAPIPVWGDRRRNIGLQAEFVSSGKKLVKPSSITLRFFSHASDRTYADNRAVTIKLDGSEVLSETAHYEEGNTNGEIFLISVTQEVSYEMFSKILAAKKVEIKIGPTEFELNESGREALRDLKKLIEQSSE